MASLCEALKKAIDNQNTSREATPAVIKEMEDFQASLKADLLKLGFTDLPDYLPTDGAAIPNTVSAFKNNYYQDSTYVVKVYLPDENETVRFHRDNGQYVNGQVIKITFGYGNKTGGQIDPIVLSSHHNSANLYLPAPDDKSNKVMIIERGSSSIRPAVKFDWLDREEAIKKMAVLIYQAMSDEVTAKVSAVLKPTL